ncbi:MAG: DUF2075 domain-containing protein [bacterium]|nr:DUF2075 domain-containing protein [bacterium]
MRLYSGSSTQFLDDTVHNQIGDKLRESFFQYFRYYPSPSEVQSWRNSLRAVSQVFDYSGLNDHGVILEYQLPQTSKRLDCMITGKDQPGNDRAVVIELKQWEKCEASDGENEVATWVGGAKREVLHPSVQVGQYKMYLQDLHPAFDGADSIKLDAVSYLHNYSPAKDDELLATKFAEKIKSNPVFCADDVDTFSEYLKDKLSGGGGLPILERVEKTEYKVSKKLMDHVSKTIKEKSEYILLDEQLIVYDKVFSLVKQGLKKDKKSVVIIRGGPGTGKSVIAINLMADLLRAGYDTNYATGSKAFTETLRKKIGVRGAVQFKYFNSYMNSKKDTLDVLVADEAHRIRGTSNNRFTKKEMRSDTPQIEELINASKIGVFFIDDDQNIRPDETGSAEFIKDTAIEMGCKVYEYELEAQFRCSGSDAFVNWVNNTLGIKRTANVIWDQKEEFDFQIIDSPQELYSKICQKNGEKQSARLVAGFCWPWSNPNSDGTLVADVKIGDFQMPWEGKPGFKLAPGIPTASLWPNDPNGVNQIGSIYTIQGFEFDYVGVIIGPDLVYNFENQTWIALRENSADSVVKRSGEKLVDLLKNTYRVLLTRGMKGCYVYFVDKETEKFFKSRIEARESYQKSSVPVLSPITLDMIRVPLVGSAPCGNPLLGEENIEDQILVEKSKIKPGYKYFILRAEGDSMNRAGINDGDLVLCRQQEKADTGDRVVALLGGENVTIKEYGPRIDGVRLLLPKSTNKSHVPITPGEGDSVQGIVQEIIEN